MEKKRIKSVSGHGMTRRDFLWLTSMSAVGVLIGCATNPVTGKSQLMLVSEDQEIMMDKKQSIYQFSSDYGPLQDNALNHYIDQTGKKIAAKTHRPNMPYSFRGVNAVYANAYAFPGGSIAVTRGMLIELENEAELAALLGHEIGHVNARHTAEQMSKSMITNAIVGGVAAYAGTQSYGLGQLASQLGMLGSGALLASYSRDNEREADALGLEYMVHAGYNPNGFVELIDVLRHMSKHKSSAIELMFSSHPMSSERYRTAVESVKKYRYAEKYPFYRERYMDHTVKLRAIKGAIETMQKGSRAMTADQYGEAETYFKTALKQAPDDYAGLVMMSQCQLAQKKYNDAKLFAETAERVYPQEPQAYYLAGFSKIKLRNFSSAYEDFKHYENMLPGNPNVIFYEGVCLEGMRHIKESANKYYEYLQIVNQGDRAKYAYRRLIEWGYVRP